MDLRTLKRNAFWVGTGGAVAILLAVYMLMVYPLYEKKQKLESTISGLSLSIEASLDRQKVYSEQDVAAVKEYKRKLGERLSETVKFYQDKDRPFEAWFPELGIAAGGEPPNGQFLATHLDKQAALDEILPFDGFVDDNAHGWFNPPHDFLTNLGAGALNAKKDLQKMYWIRSRFVSSLEPMIKAEGGDAVKVFALGWARDFYARQGGGRPKGAEHRKWNFGREGYLGYDGGPAGYLLPGDSGGAYVFMANFDIRLHDLPEFMRSFLSFSGQEPSMFIELLGIHLRTFTEEVTETTVSVKQQDSDKVKQETRQKARKALKPSPVRIWLTVRVLDPEQRQMQALLEKALNPG